MLRAFLDRELPDPPISRLTGLRLSEVGLAMAAAAMPASGWWQSGAGVFLAGTIAFVADLPLSCAVLTSAPPGTVVTSSHLSVSFLRPATLRSDRFIGRGRLIHGTRSLGLAEAIVEDGRGRLLGHATSRCVLMPLGSRVPEPLPAAPAAAAELPDPHLREVEGDVEGQEFWDATPGHEVVRRVAAGTFRPPVSLLFDWRGVASAEGEMTMAMPPSPWVCNAFGIVYGGALAAFADIAMTLAVGSTVPAAHRLQPARSHRPLPAPGAGGGRAARGPRPRHPPWPDHRGDHLRRRRRDRQARRRGLRLHPDPPGAPLAAPRPRGRGDGGGGGLRGRGRRCRAPRHGPVAEAGGIAWSAGSAHAGGPGARPRRAQSRP